MLVESGQQHFLILVLLPVAGGKIPLSIDFHQQGFMKQEKINLICLPITWINDDFEMSGEGTLQERGEVLFAQTIHIVSYYKTQYS